MASQALLDAWMGHLDGGPVAPRRAAPRPLTPSAASPDITENFEATECGKKVTRRLHDAIRSRRDTPLRVAVCGRHGYRGSTGATITSARSLDAPGRGAVSVGGVARCGLVHECPSCRRTESMERAREVQRVLEDARRLGWTLIFVTFTVRHSSLDITKNLVKGVRKSWRAMFSGRWWRELREELGPIQTIRALESTYGQNGAHPHIHAVFGVPPAGARSGPRLAGTRRSPEDEGELMWSWREEWPARWADTVARVLGADHRPDEDHGCLIEVVASPSDIAHYVGKIGLELALDTKKTKNLAGKTPLNILAEWVDTGDESCWALWRRHCDAWRGERLLTWSREWGGPWRLEAQDGIEDERRRTTETRVVAVVPSRDYAMVATRRPAELWALLDAVEALADGPAEDQRRAWSRGWSALVSSVRCDHDDDVSEVYRDLRTALQAA